MTWFLLALGLLPSFAWLEFYLREDTHPEPKFLLVKTFLYGIIFALVALFVQASIACSYLFAHGLRCSDIGTSNFTTTLPFLVIFATVEEVVKFCAAYFAVRKSSAFNEPIDAMIYLVVASLSFAAVENIGILFDPVRSHFIGDSVRLVSLRFVGATLLHTLASAVAGYYWAVSIRDFKATRFIFLGLVIASGLHTFFNYLILTKGNLMYTLVFVSCVAFFVLSDFEKLKGKAL